MTEEQANELATRLAVALLAQQAVVSKLLPGSSRPRLEVADVAAPTAALVLAIRDRLLASPTSPASPAAAPGL